MSTNEPTAEQITPEQWAKAKRLAVELHFATGDYAVARCHELLSRAERAERERDEAKEISDAFRLLEKIEVRREVFVARMGDLFEEIGRWRCCIEGVDGDHRSDTPAKSITLAVTAALTRNSAGGGA